MQQKYRTVLRGKAIESYFIKICNILSIEHVNYTWRLFDYLFLLFYETYHFRLSLTYAWSNFQTG